VASFLEAAEDLLPDAGPVDPLAAKRMSTSILCQLRSFTIQCRKA
jgi:hypothetical protein